MIEINSQEELNNLDIDTVRGSFMAVLNNVKYIPEGKFYGLSNLSIIDIKDTEIVGTGAFMNCENLEKIFSNNKIKEIRDFAFYNTKVGFIPELYENAKFGVYNNLNQNICLMDLSWSEIGKLADLGKMKEYFNVGDGKLLTINEITYIVKIYDFNHDYLADGINKTSATFGFSEVFATKLAMNILNTNSGGWKNSSIREYLNTVAIKKFPEDLQKVIKEVKIISDTGKQENSRLIYTNDKLFLPSLDEVGVSSPLAIANQGYKYDIFSDNSSRVRYNMFDINTSSRIYWWLRTSRIDSLNRFWFINSMGEYCSSSANYTLGIAPCFCI